MKRLAVMLLLVLTLSACEPSAKNATGEPTPQPTPRDPAREAAKAEEEFQGDEDIYARARQEAREAATSYVKTNYPEWTIKGLSSEAVGSNAFRVNVDIQHDKQNSIVSLGMRKFFPVGGDPYWKAMILEPEGK